MRGRARRAGTAVAIVALAALGAGCSSTPPDVTTPTMEWSIPDTFGPCDHVVVYPSSDVPGFVAAYAWDDDVHAYGEEVTFTACFDHAWEAIPEGPPGVIFDPAQQKIPEAQDNFIKITITVPKGSTGQTFVRLNYPEGDTFATPPGPTVTPSGDGWKFTSPDRS